MQTGNVLDVEEAATMMLIGVALLVVVVVIAAWVNHTRDARRQWIKDLDLMGTWDLDTSESDDPTTCFRFTGNLDKGDFVLESSGEKTIGTWKLAGTSLVLNTEEAGDRQYEIRYFGTGTIGLSGTDRERQVFNKRVENIVPLRRRS